MRMHEDFVVESLWLAGGLTACLTFININTSKSNL